LADGPEAVAKRIRTLFFLQIREPNVWPRGSRFGFVLSDSFELRHVLGRTQWQINLLRTQRHRMRLEIRAQ
jgi:hypothetical protein